MTKRSNSFILRLGYSLFWDQKKTSFFIFFRFRYLVLFLKKELYKYSFVFLTLNYISTAFIITMSTIFRTIKRLGKISNIFFFNIDFQFFNYISIFYNKIKTKSNTMYLHNSKTYNDNCIYRFKYLELLHFSFQFSLKCIVSFDAYYNMLNFINSFVLYSKLKKNLRNIFFKVYLIKAWIKNNKYFFCLKNSSLITWFYFSKILNFKSLSNFKLFKILIVRKLELFLETLFIFHYKISLNIYLVNILNVLHNMYIFKKKKLYKSKELRKKIMFYYISFYLKSAEFLCKYFGSILLTGKYHLRMIRYCLNNIYKLYLIQLINFYGFKLHISGKLNGKMRKSKYFYKIGKMLLNTFKTKLQCYFLPLYTKYGIFSIKVWLSY